MTANVYLLWGAALNIAFVAASLAFPIEWLRIFAALLMLVSSLLVSSFWVPHGLMAFQEGKVSKAHISLVAMSMVMTGICMFSLYSTGFNVAGRPQHWADWPVWQYIQIYTSVGLLVLCSNPGARAPVLSIPRLGFYLAIGVVIFCLGYALRDVGGDISPVSRWPL